MHVQGVAVVKIAASYVLPDTVVVEDKTFGAITPAATTFVLIESVVHLKTDGCCVMVTVTIV